MIQEVILAGFGGQGILLAGKLLAQAGMNDGYYATWFPSYGPEMRGGTANCTVVYADDEIGSPIASEYNSVIAMNQPSLDRFALKAKAKGDVFVNSTLININDRRDDVTYYEVPANELAIGVGSDRSANVVMIGAYIAAKDMISAEKLQVVLREEFARKGDKVVEMNLKALEAGAKAVKK